MHPEFFNIRSPVFKFVRNFIAIHGLVDTGYNLKFFNLGFVHCNSGAADEMLMEQDPPVLPVAWEKIIDIWYNYVKGHNPYEYFGIYDCVRFDTFWLDKA